MGKYKTVPLPKGTYIVAEEYWDQFLEDAEAGGLKYTPTGEGAKICFQRMKDNASEALAYYYGTGFRCLSYDSLSLNPSCTEYQPTPSSTQLFTKSDLIPGLHIVEDAEQDKYGVSKYGVYGIHNNYYNMTFDEYTEGLEYIGTGEDKELLNINKVYEILDGNFNLELVWERETAEVKVLKTEIEQLEQELISKKEQLTKCLGEG